MKSKKGSVQGGGGGLQSGREEENCISTKTGREGGVLAMPKVVGGGSTKGFVVMIMGET